MALMPCFLAFFQNSYAPIHLVSRFDGGLSQLLRGDGQGRLEAVATAESGLVVPGDAKALADNVVRLLDPVTNQQHAQRALALHQSQYSPEAVGRALRASYDKAVAAHADAVRTRMS